MASSDLLVSIVKQLTLVILVLAIALPIRYGSTDPKHLQIRLFHSLFSIFHSLVSDPARPNLSADYRAFETLMRRKPLVKDDLTADPREIAKKVRSSFRLGTVTPRPSECKVHKQMYTFEKHSVEAYWVKHHGDEDEMDTNRIILYFHGGGYIAGNVQAYSGFECHLSRLFNVTVIHLEYRLAPEHPLPAAVDDALVLYCALLREGISSSNLIIIGDSAGGGLTLLTVQALIARHIPKPRAVITMSPWADLSSSGESYTRNRLTDLMIRSEILKWGIKQVLGPNHPQIARDNSSYSPLFGSFKAFPPMYITVGTAELLESDSRQVADKARREGVDVTLDVGEHLMHVHPIFFHYYHEARDTLHNIYRWVETIFQQKINN